ncbi:DUF1932 domain-containing protein [Gordonia sp. CPCC 205515]|uniref:NAD(P)-dependent oxidoreductase n=1 Tax=Gordonia sp. CPCC 205515 TaxID=3140791 RepID=UPI003AF38A42
MTHILVLHPGNMGAGLGASLVAAGHRVSWVPAGRSTETAERAHRAGLRPWEPADRPDLVLSVVPPAHAQETAASFGHAADLYVDANAISPATAAGVARVVEESGGTYVDGSIIGAPPDPGRARATRLYLSGDAADAAATLLSCGPELEIPVLPGDTFAASSLKMAYASWTKISAALLLSARAVADDLGVGDALDAEWRHSQPDLIARHESAVSSASGKAWRWVEEMRQIAETFESTGSPGGFGTAAAQVFERYPNLGVGPR